MSRQKHLLLILLSFSIAWHCLGQENTTPSAEKNEVYLTVFSFRSGYGYLDELDYVVSFFNGVGYKRHIGNHAIRLGLGYKNDHYNWRYEAYGTESYREGKFNLGYQFNLMDKSVQPYVAADLLYLVAKYKSESMGGWWGDWYSMQNLDQHGIGFGTALGIKFILPKSFSIAFEGNIEFLWIHSKGTTIRNEYPNPSPRNTYPVDTVDFTTFSNPLQSFSLNYTF